MYFAEEMDTFDEWYNCLKKGKEVYPRIMIPFEEWKNEYINNIKNKSDEEVKTLLRYLLVPYTREIDVENHRLFIDMLGKLDENSNKDLIHSINQIMSLEVQQRIKGGYQAWEGLTWVIRMLPYHPYKATKAIQMYLDAELKDMPDERIIGLNQCIEIIEKKYIYGDLGKEVLYDLKSRDFEYLIELLYQGMGYTTILTPATRDGGKDVIAKIEREDGIEEVYVECKLYERSELTNNHVKILRDTINENKATRGVIFCTGRINRNLKDMDKRIQVWDLEEINFLFNAHLGADWVKRLHHLLNVQRMKYENKK